MEKSVRQVTRLSKILGVVLVALLILTGCDAYRLANDIYMGCSNPRAPSRSEPGATSGYTKLTTENSICYISFEYPAHYNVDGPRVVTNFEDPFFFVNALAEETQMPMVIPGPSGQGKTYDVSFIPAGLTVSVFDASARDGRAKSDLEYRHTKLETWGDYELLDRSSITVSGIEAEQIIYKQHMILPGITHTKTWNREIYFDRDGLIWVIDASATEDMVELVNGYLERLLETLVIYE